MATQVTADFFSLCDVRVSRYSYDAALQTAAVTFKLTAYKTRAHRYYPVQLQAAPTQTADTTTTLAWQQIWTANRADMIAFVESETAKPLAWTAFQVPTVFPPYWVTGSALGDFEPGSNISVTLVCALATNYALSLGELPTGLVLDAATGELQGVSVNGSYTFSITATDGGTGLSTTQSFTMRVIEVPVFVPPAGH